MQSVKVSPIGTSVNPGRFILVSVLGAKKESKPHGAATERATYTSDSQNFHKNCGT